MSDSVSPTPGANSLPASRAVRGEVVTTELVDKAYDQLGLDGMFETYARHTGDAFLEEDVHLALVDLAVDVASMSFNGGEIDVELVRRAFDRTYAGMNQAARNARNMQLPTTPFQSLLIKAGIKQPEYMRAVAPLDDRYWSRQFMEQFADESMIKRIEDEPEEVYLARYISRCLEGFPWAHFTYAV